MRTRGDQGGNEQVPDQFLDFSERHGLDSRYTLWGASLLFGSFALFVAALFLSSKDAGWLFWILTVVGGCLVGSSIPLLRTKRRRRAARMEAYERWRSQQMDE